MPERHPLYSDRKGLFFAANDASDSVCGKSAGDDKHQDCERCAACLTSVRETWLVGSTRDAYRTVTCLARDVAVSRGGRTAREKREAVGDRDRARGVTSKTRH